MSVLAHMVWEVGLCKMVQVHVGISLWIEEFWIESFDEWVTSEAVWALGLCDHIYELVTKQWFDFSILSTVY